ncbi:hypothetical protein BJ546DRAFT_1085497 [Cryomyces antarcticus]
MSSSSRKGRNRVGNPDSTASRDTGSSVLTSRGLREPSSAGSAISYETSASSVQDLPPLQTKGIQNDFDQLEPLMEDDPQSFDLVAPAYQQTTNVYSLEKRSEQMLSKEHLTVIFADPRLLSKFTSFLSAHRPSSVPILAYYLDALKALKAIKYANAIVEALEPINGRNFTEYHAPATVNAVLEDQVNKAFEAMVQDDLPAYIAYIWTQVVRVIIRQRITGNLAPHLQFHRTTQYGMSYSIGRNCRFLQGPRTNLHSVSRLAECVVAGEEHCEVFVNYRRDGSPFMNLLMTSPLLDSLGTIRYFLGAQVDVSGLLKDCRDLEALQRLVAKEEGAEFDTEEEKKDEFQELSEIFNVSELSTVRRYGGRMHGEQVEGSDPRAGVQHRPRLLLKDSIPDLTAKTSNFGGAKASGKLEGICQNVSTFSSPQRLSKVSTYANQYLLVRPYPSLRVLSTSPSLRFHGTLQSSFMNRIGGPSRVRDELTAAFSEGRGVTVKVRWTSHTDDEGRSRWIYCTPLVGHSGSKLTSVQKEALIEHANKLTDTGLPSTPQMVRDIAEEIARTQIVSHWVARFCQRHRRRLFSVYLRTIDHERKVADSS